MYMKKLVSILVLIIFILGLSGCSEENEKLQPTESFYVNDFADIIDDSAEKELQSKSVALNKKTTSQVVVVTIETLDGEEASQFALNLGREWGVGDEENDNGIVILLSLEEREIYIAVGYGLEGALPDSKTGRIIDRYGLEHLKNDDFSQGLLKIGNAIINEVYLEYGLEPEEGYVSIDSLPEENTSEDEPLSVVISWIILIVILLIVFGGTRRRRGIYWFGGPPTGGFGSGGFGSGSDHSGGGFGGFSGGGGSFGGGGAGRGF